MKTKMNPALMVAGAVLVVCVAIFLLFRQATAPRETINDFSKIPPKGAGRTDRQ